jgi:hypothetical protein
MAFLIAIALSFLFLGGFLALVRYETGHGTRYFADVRGRMDSRVAKAAFVVRHVDWSAVIAHAVRSASARVVHDVAHATLIIVRILERLLTRIVRYLRTSRQQAALTSDKKRFDMKASLAQLRSTWRKIKEEQGSL